MEQADVWDRLFGTRAHTPGAALQLPRKVPIRVEPKSWFGAPLPLLSCALFVFGCTVLHRQMSLLCTVLHAPPLDKVRNAAAAHHVTLHADKALLEGRLRVCP